MDDATPLLAHTRIAFDDPAAALSALRACLADAQGAVATQESLRLRNDLGAVDIAIADGAICVDAACPDAGKLFIVKSFIAEKLAEHAGRDSLDCVWSDAGAVAPELPFFRVLEVCGARQITPSMRRVTLAGDAAHFAKGGLHARILIPPRGRAPVWPSLRGDGGVRWPRGADELAGRVYTIRHVHIEQSRLDVDVVLHGNSTGSVWARDARPGDLVGVMGPGGGDVVEADLHVLCGDETALPAIARMLEALPCDARVIVRIEVANADEEQSLHTRASADIRYLHRGEALPGRTGLIERSLRALDWADAERRHVFVGCEHAEAKAIRSFLQCAREKPKGRTSVAGYWRL